MEFLAPYALALLATVFLVSGASKVLNQAQFHGTLAALDMFPTYMTKVVVRALPALELVVGILLIFGSSLTVTVGAMAGIVLLLLFIVTTVRAITAGKSDIQCACFGPLRETTFGAGLILQNVLLISLATYVLVLARLATPGLFDHFSGAWLVAVVLPVVALLPTYMLTTFFLSHSEYYSKSRPLNPDGTRRP